MQCCVCSRITFCFRKPLIFFKIPVRGDKHRGFHFLIYQPIQIPAIKKPAVITAGFFCKKYLYLVGGGGNIPFRTAWNIRSTFPALLNRHVS